MQKKYYVFMFIFIASFTRPCAELMDTQNWRNNFKQLLSTKWDGYNATQNRWQKLGHNPHITLIEKNHANASGPTLVIHDWASSKDAPHTHNLCLSKNIPGDVITFNFRDASYWFKHIIPYWMPITKSNFAGKEDILDLLCVLKTLHSINCLPAIWYAHSRGAGVAQAVAALLNCPSETEQNLLTEWNIQPKNCSEILCKLKIIYLLNPFTSIEVTLNNKIQSSLFFLDYIFPVINEMMSAKINSRLQKLPSDLKNELATKVNAIKKNPQSFVKKYISPLITNHILPLLTCYKPQQKNPIDYIPQLNNIETNIWLHLEEKDTNIIQQFLSALPEGHLYVSYNNNDEKNTFETLNNTSIALVDAFNLANGCGHYWGESTHKAKRIIQDAQLSKTMTENDIEKHLNVFEKNHIQRNFWQHRITKRFITFLKTSLLIFLLCYLNSSPYGIFGYHFRLNDSYLNIYKNLNDLA